MELPLSRTALKSPLDPYHPSQRYTHTLYPLEQKPRTENTSMSRSRPSSRGSSHGGTLDAHEQQQLSLERAYDFCNAYWTRSQRRRAANGEDEMDWGEEGFRTLTGRMKMGTRTLEELRALLKERYVTLRIFRLGLVHRGGRVGV